MRSGAINTGNKSKGLIYALLLAQIKCTSIQRGVPLFKSYCLFGLFATFHTIGFSLQLFNQPGSFTSSMMPFAWSSKQAIWYSHMEDQSPLAALKEIPICRYGGTSVCTPDIAVTYMTFVPLAECRVNPCCQFA
jgi:hypothetical protein